MTNSSRPFKQGLSLAGSVLLCGALGVAAAQAQTQAVHPSGRVSLFGQASSTKSADGGDTRTYGELVTTLTVQSPTKENNGLEYGFDFRFATYPTSEARPNRISVYDAHVTQRLNSGALGIKAGQMWINELGALGSTGGVLAEVRRPKHKDGGRFRFGAFGGLEPRILEAGYVSGIRKFGGYAVYDGSAARRHAVGYVNLRNQNLTERSVMVFTNFLPVGQKFFLYQAAEYDLSGPAGNGDGGLNYFMTNARISPSAAVELQGVYHRGRSVDTRAVTLDQLNGRPIDQRALEGMLYASAGGRVTVTIAKGVRVFGGYARDRNNRDDDATGRATFGVYAADLFRSGVDLNVSDTRTDRGATSSYDSLYVSIGRSVGPRVYLTGEFTSSLSVFSFTGSDGFTIENRPRTKRFGGSSVINLNRHVSLLATGERTLDDAFSEMRLLAGLAYRF